MFDRFRVWVQGHPRDVAITAVLGVMAFAVAVASLTALSGRNEDVTPVVAERGPGPASSSPAESGEAAPLAPGGSPSEPATSPPEPAGSSPSEPATGSSPEPSALLGSPPGSPPPSERPRPLPSRSPSPLPVRPGRWSGVAEVGIAGQEFGCTATRKTIRQPATLVVSAPIAGEGNVVHLAFLSSRQGVEGAFEINSSSGATRSWTLSGDGSGGFVGRLTTPAALPLGSAGPTENVLAAAKSLDERCGAAFSAPVNYAMAGGSALRVALKGTHAQALLTGGTLDHTRTFRIEFRTA